ncbi:secretion protein [Burkholderia sp. Nafp2/4-1b]|nr:secretion protein [Burkholderia sp. Nafp2/4-1b]
MDCSGRTRAPRILPPGAAMIVGVARRQLEQDGHALSAMHARVSMQEAASALGRVLHKFDHTLGTNGSGLSLEERCFEDVSMETMLLATTLLSATVLGNTAELKSKALEIMCAKQEEVRRQEIKDCREQIDKAIEQQQKAKKAGILGVIFDWIIAAVEVLIGVAKIIGGVFSGNVTMVAGGATDVMAGAAGVVKATMNTLALIDEKNADTYRQIADVAAKVQLTFEIVGAVIDVTSAARNMLLTKAIPRATMVVLEKGAGKALQQAVKAGSTLAVERVAQAAGREVAEQVSAQICRELGRVALKASKKVSKDAVQKMIEHLGVNRMLESFSREAIEKMVTKAVEKAGKDAINRGVELTARELKAIVKKLARDAMVIALKASVSPLLTTARAMAPAVNQMSSGVLAIERAKLQKEIDRLILDQQWLQMCFEFYKQQKEAQQKGAKELIEKAAQAVEDGSQALKESGAVQLHVAASMV